MARLSWCVGACALIGWILPVAALNAQGTPDQGALAAALAEVDLTAPPAISVTLDFAMESIPSGGSVPLTGLRFGGVALERLAAFDTAGRPLVLRTEGGARGQVSVTVDLPMEAGGAFRLSYEVGSGVSSEGTLRRYTIPLIVPRWPPSDAVSGVFTLTVTLPEAERILTSFPEGFRSIEGRERPIFSLELQVAPTLLTLVTSTETGVPITLTGLLDVLVLMVFLAAGALGLRHLRRGRR